MLPEKYMHSVHLAYHICPIGNWFWNLKQLEHYSTNIDWKFKVVGLVEVEGVDTDAVEEEIYRSLGDDTEIIRAKNHPTRRESVTFPLIMKKLERLVEHDSAIWFGHTKGTTHTDTKLADATKIWTAASYYFNLDINHLIENLDALEQGYCCAGAFKRLGRWTHLPLNAHGWHYSGTFFWMRSDAFVGSPWKNLFRNPKRYSVESLPGALWKKSDGYCVFGANISDLYELATWEKLLSPELIRQFLK